LTASKVEEYRPTSRIVNGTVARTRPLCPYGKVAKWNGKGSTDDIANFSCVVDEEAGGR
jgi:hypothetical protein